MSADLSRADPKDQFARLALVVSGRSLGYALFLAGRPREGIPHLRTARATAADVLREDPANGFAREELESIDFYLGKVLLSAAAPAQRAEGCGALRRTRDAWQAAEAAGRFDANAASDLEELRGLLGRCGTGAP